MLDWILTIDHWLFTHINSVWTHPSLDIFFPVITDLHKTAYFKFALVPLILVLFMWRRGVKKGLLIFIFALLSVGLADATGNYAFKKTVQRERPANDPSVNAIVRSPFGGYSFVSNHATNNFAFAIFVSSFFPASTIWLYAIATLVAYSRIYNGVHFPTDIICGALIGLFVGYLMSIICHKVLNLLSKRKPQ